MNPPQGRKRSQRLSYLMYIQKAKIIDLKTIISWVSNKQACKMWAGPCVSFPLRIEKLSKDIGFSGDNSYCYKNDGSIFAFGQLLTKENGWLHLARIIVDPAKRGKGYGKLLCVKLIQIAIQKGYQKISLNVYRNNANAFNLYTNLGFREVAELSSEENCHMVNPYSGSAVDSPSEAAYKS